MKQCSKCGRYYEETHVSAHSLCPECSQVTYSNNTSTYNIGLKEVKFCKYCGSKNIIQTNGICKQYNCLECGTQKID